MKRRTFIKSGLALAGGAASALLLPRAAATGRTGGLATRLAAFARRIRGESSRRPSRIRHAQPAGERAVR